MKGMGKMDAIMTPVISVNDVKELIKNTAPLTLLDARGYLPNIPQNGQEEYKKNHITGAKFFDIDACVDLESSLPHSLPNADVFSEYVQNLGVNRGDNIVVYDQMGFFSAPRVRWMFKYFGHENIAVLDGGFPAWLADGGDVEGGDIPAKKGDFLAHIASPGRLATKDDILAIVTAHPDGLNTQKIIVDARPNARFLGVEAEPRKGVQSGHMPGAVNISFTDIFDKETGKIKPADILAGIFHTKLRGDEIICSCGSGVTACVLALGLEICGYKNIRLYDGSWSEWGSDKSNPITSPTKQ